MRQPQVIYIRFLLKYGHLLDVGMNETEAIKLIKDWADKKMADRISGWDQVQPDRNWAIETSEIVSIFTMTAEFIQQQTQLAQRQIGSVRPSFGSGYNPK